MERAGPGSRNAPVRAVAGTTLLEHLRELHERDEVLGRELALVGALEEDVGRIREQAGELARFFERLPNERARLETSLADAHAELKSRAAAERIAEQLVEQAERSGDERTLRETGHSLQRARDARGGAERREAALALELTELEQRAGSATEDVRSLEGDARGIAARIHGTARISATGRAAPDEGLPGLADWASRTRASLFVVRAGLEREREPLLRQANELVSSKLGEPLFAATVSLALRRLEDHSPPAW